MINRLARRLGFQTTVPVSAVDEWLLPSDPASSPLAPRGGEATCLVDRLGRLQPAHEQWTLDWSLAAGARWVSAIESERVTQRFVAPSAIETVVQTPAGEVVQRVAAAVVDGEPVAIVEFENRGGVAIAAAVVARPLVHGGRGFLGEATTSSSALDLGEAGAVRFGKAAATAVSDGADLLTALPEPDAGVDASAVHSRAGAAQAAAVFPLPHTATVRMVIELGSSVRAAAAVPTVDDVQRGWGVHLDAGARYDVGDTDVAERTRVAARGLLTGWPDRLSTPQAITALAELGFGNDSVRLFGDLEKIDDDAALIASVARWAMLGESVGQLEALDRIIGPVARAASLAADGPTIAGPSWLAAGWQALADRLELVDQPDVAARVRGLDVGSSQANADDLLDRSTDLQAFAEPALAARSLIGVRDVLLADTGDGVDLVPALPKAWRGQTVNVIDAPIAGGTVSYGLRWHGPRPAVLWQVDRETAPDAPPVVVTASGIDGTFRSTDPSGETLLADPGWPRTK